MVDYPAIYFAQYMMSEHKAEHVSRWLKNTPTYEVGFECGGCGLKMSGYVLHVHEANKKDIKCLNCKRSMRHTGLIRIIGEDEGKERLVV